MTDQNTRVKRRVALFSTNFLAFSQTFIFDEIRHHHNYDVEVFCHRRMNEDKFPYNKVHCLDQNGGFIGKLNNFVYKTTTLSRSRLTELQSGNFDLIHAHFGPGSIYTIPYKTALKLPLVVTYHGYDVPLLMTYRRYHPEYWRYWLMSSTMFRVVDRFLAASNELARLLIELGAPPEKVKVWRLGVEIPERVKKTERTGSLIVLMVGRFVEKKGIEFGIEAFGKALEMGADLELHIVGDGPRKGLYQKVIKRMGIQDRVRFLGIFGHQEVLDKMCEVDIMLAPSVISKNGDRESGILVVKEANARMVPAIGSIHGGIPEIIDDKKTGFLVPERNTDELADRLLKLADNKELREKMGRAAREKMLAEYNIKQRVKSLEEHYDEVIAQHRSSDTDRSSH